MNEHEGHQFGFTGMISALFSLVAPYSKVV